jgi:Amt family ammonium transporter
LDVFPVHGVGGCVGSILTGVFAAESLGGLGLNGVSMLDQVGVQTLAVLVTAVWSAVFSYGLLKLIDLVIGLRVMEDEEQQGLDIVLHEETGYHNL